jgi:hypothetical protein
MLIFWQLLLFHVIPKGTGIVFPRWGMSSFQVFCKEISSCVKGNNISKSSRHFKTVVKKKCRRNNSEVAEYIISPEANI